jgi:hypothetical protein
MMRFRHIIAVVSGAMLTYINTLYRRTLAGVPRGGVPGAQPGQAKKRRVIN